MGTFCQKLASSFTIRTLFRRRRTSSLPLARIVGADQGLQAGEFVLVERDTRTCRLKLSRGSSGEQVRDLAQGVSELLVQVEHPGGAGLDACPPFEVGVNRVLLRSA